MQTIKEWLLSQPKIVTRAGICPFISARGSIALAELRTHLFNYVLTRYVILKGGSGTFMLRCDDTDTTSTDLHYMSSIVTLFNEILEIKPDLHPYYSEHVFEYPLIQSRRSTLYTFYIQKLLTEGLVYETNGKFPLIFSVEKYIARHGQFLMAPDLLLGNRYHDLLQEQRIHDFPITRSDGSSLWHLCSVVDDYHSGVGLVVRARDKIGNLPYQEMLRVALDFPSKHYIHLPLLMGNNRKEAFHFLSTVDEVMKYGISSKAIVLYLCTSLFKNKDKIYLDLDEWIKGIDFSELIRSNNHFDFNKLLYIHKTLNAKLQKEDYLKELNKSAFVHQDENWICRVLDKTSQNLLNDLRLDYIHSKKTLALLNSPTYLPFLDIKSHGLLSVFVKLFLIFAKVRGTRGTMALMKSILEKDKLLENDQSIVPVFRYILTGSPEGISIFKIMEYLEISNISIVERIKKLNVLYP